MKLTARDIDNRVLAQYPMTFRNDNGMAYVGGKKEESGSDIIIVNPHRIKYGLFPGSGDRIGWQTVRITDADVGRIIAQFLSIEIKTRTDRLSQAQINWADAVIRDGGRVEIWKDTAKGLEVSVWPVR
jgi:hypothetical protein